MQNYLRNLILLVVIISLAGCQTGIRNTRSDTDLSLKVIDVQGNSISMEKPAERIICLSDPIVDLLYMLGSDDKLVGVPLEIYEDKELYNYYRILDSRLAERSLAALGTNHSVHVEAVLSLKPDLLVVQHLSENMVEALRNMGIPVYHARSETYEDIIKELDDIASLTGKEKRANELRLFAESALADMRQRVNEIASEERRKVYFTWANGRVFSTTGRNGMMHDCLTYAGVDNVCEAPIPQPNVNAETLIGWNPDMIIMWNDSPDLFYNRTDLKTITAIRNRQIFNLMPMFFYNPHTLKALCASSLIYEWAYGSGLESKREVRDQIIFLYGAEKATKILPLL